VNRRILLRVFPYVASVLAGSLFLLIGLRLSDNIKGLLTSIAVAFFAIPLIYLLYQVAQNLSQKRLNREIFDYAKMQIDREILSTINQLLKILYPLEEKHLSQAGVSRFLSLGEDDLKRILSENEYLGFQVLKDWEATEESLHEILKNSFILKSLKNDQIISIISIVKSLRHLQGVQKGAGLYARTEKEATSYRIVAGEQLNRDNIRFPNRYLLLRDLTDSKYILVDFGDFHPYNIDKLLQVFVVDHRFIGIYGGAIFDLLREINNWINSTGREFVVDTKMFRLGHGIVTGD